MEFYAYLISGPVLLKSNNKIMDKRLIPNSTQIPNIILDLLVPLIPEAEGKCIMYICRRTFGFHKEEDRISFSQFIKGIKDKNGKILDRGTGLVRDSVNTAIKNLLKAEAISVSRTTKGNIYRINLDMDVDEVVRKIDQSRKQTKISLKNRPKQVRLLDLQKKGNKGNKVILVDKKLSTYQQFINFFYEITEKTRGIKPIITGKDGKNLKRVLALNILNSTELEQLALYFLANHYYKKFTPSVSTFLSAGILNGLANSLKNREEFWKEMNQYTQQYFDDSPKIKRSDNIDRKIVEVKDKIGVWKK